MQEHIFERMAREKDISVEKMREKRYNKNAY